MGALVGFKSLVSDWCLEKRIACDGDTEGWRVRNIETSEYTD